MKNAIPTTNTDHLCLRGTQNHIYHINVADIYYIRADSLCSYIMCAGCLYHVRHQLIQLEELTPDYFLKLNRSVLLNTRQILSVHDDCIEFSNFTKLVISARKAKWLKEKLREHTDS